MIITGVMLVFSTAVLHFLPKVCLDLAQVIHLYEAILATLAIVIWHFYHVIFDPDVYPMSWAWFDGKMSEHQFKEEHPKAYEEEAERNEEKGASS
jgi:cytochrome b subunit of formate dehydrogenase